LLQEIKTLISMKMMKLVIDVLISIVRLSIGLSNTHLQKPFRDTIL
jgi:hypothetical protein